MHLISLTTEDVTNYPEVKGNQFGFEGKVGVIRDMDCIVGFYTVEIDEPSIKLNEVEIIEECQGIGYGKMFIKALFDKYPSCNEIVGISLEDSEAFYAVIGANMFESCEECSYDVCNHHPDNLDGVQEMEKCDEYSSYEFRLKRESFHTYYVVSMAIGVAVGTV